LLLSLIIVLVKKILVISVLQEKSCVYYDPKHDHHKETELAVENAE
jgi:hypothetical protein